MTGFRYLIPFLFLSLVPTGALLGGAWTFLPLLAILASLTLLARLVGNERTPQVSMSGRRIRWAPRLYIVSQLAITAWAALWVGRGTRPIETLGLTLSIGVTAGIFGFLAAHEMIHSRDKREWALGLAFLASVFYMHFRIAHLFGHHRRAATPADPTTARLGESFYAFAIRSVSGQLREAWSFEARRLGRSGRTALTPANRLMIYFAIEISILATTAFYSIRALILLLGSAAVAICLLEVFNYVAHYGLSRQREGDRGYELLQPKHSWNSREWMNNAALLNMGCHTDHHQNPDRSFHQLKSETAEAELPSSYAMAVLLAFIPPLWRSRMDTRALEAMRS